MNPFEMVVLIVAIVMIASVFRARYRTSDSESPARFGKVTEETRQLRDEVRALKERVAVLERIATDRGSLLEQEIEQLRDRSPLSPSPERSAEPRP